MNNWSTGKNSNGLKHFSGWSEKAYIREIRKLEDKKSRKKRVVLTC